MMLFTIADTAFNIAENAYLIYLLNDGGGPNIINTTIFWVNLNRFIRSHYNTNQNITIPIK